MTVISLFILTFFPSLSSPLILSRTRLIEAQLDAGGINAERQVTASSSYNQNNYCSPEPAASLSNFLFFFFFVKTFSDYWADFCRFGYAVHCEIIESYFSGGEYCVVQAGHTL